MERATPLPSPLAHNTLSPRPLSPISLLSRGTTTSDAAKLLTTLREESKESGALAGYLSALHTSMHFLTATGRVGGCLNLNPGVLGAESTRRFTSSRPQSEPVDPAVTDKPHLVITYETSEAVCLCACSDLSFVTYPPRKTVEAEEEAFLSAARNCARSSAERAFRWFPVVW
ncbi:hypothetical protein MRX96_053381 [Rhipicephalus microplus]